MKTVIALLAASAAISMGGVPKKVPLSHYESLWTKSPITNPPTPVISNPSPSRLDDFALIGVTSLGDNQYRVTLIDKKAPEAERIYVSSDTPNPAYAIVKVNRTPGDAMSTTVTLRSGNDVRTIGFDPKFLTVAKPATPATPSAAPIPSNNSKIPRPRATVPTPTPGRP